MQKSIKEAAPGVGSTQGGNAKCDNISIPSLQWIRGKVKGGGTP